MRESNRNELMKGWDLLRKDEPLVVMSFKPAMIGVFTDKESLDTALNQKRIKVVYTPLNKVKKVSLEKLPVNEFGRMQTGGGISAKDIKELNYFFVDIDVVGLQKNGVKRNATDEEHEEAKNVAMRAKEFLINMNFPQPIVIDSANGYHLVYKVDLSATQAHEKLLKKVLKALAEKVDTDKAKIDTVVADRGRKIKLPGSTNNMEEEFGRVSYIVEAPEEEYIVTEAMLEEVAKLSKKKGAGWKNSSSQDDDKDEAGLAEIAESIGRYYISDSGQFYADIKIDGDKTVTYNLRSDEFRYHMRRLIKEVMKVKLLKADYWKELLDYLEVLASSCDEKVTIYNRIGKKDNAILYDLQTDDYKSVEITDEEYEIIDTPAGVFQRADLDLTQVEPVFDENYDYWGVMSELFNFRDSKELELFTLWLISTYIPDIAHPLLLISGPHGSAKSTTCSMIQSLVSPQKLDRSTFPRKVSDLVIRLANRCICVFDNCSKLSLDASDALCSCCTGGSYEKRKLYTDSQLITIPLKSSVVLNSCETLIERPDLLSRTLQFNLLTLDGEKLKSDDAIQKRFEKEKPYILGFVFMCVAHYMDQDETIDESDINYVVRMTQFQKVAMKIGNTAFGMSNEYIEKLLLENKKQINIQVLETNPVSFLVLNFMKDKKEWSGSVTNLYDKIDTLAFNLGIERNNRLYPRHAAALSMRLNSLASILEQAGITFHIKPSGNYKKITIKNKNRILKVKEYKGSDNDVTEPEIEDEWEEQE